MSRVESKDKNLVRIERPFGDIFRNQQLRSVAFCFLGYMEFVITNEKTGVQKRYAISKDTNHGNCYYLTVVESKHNYIGYFKTNDIQKLQFKLNKPKRRSGVETRTKEYKMIKILFENVAKMTWPDEILLALDSLSKCPICRVAVDNNSFKHLLSMHMDCYLNNTSYEVPPKIMNIVRSTDGLTIPDNNMPEQPHKEIT